jgi:hypothetical protein
MIMNAFWETYKRDVLKNDIPPDLEEVFRLTFLAGAYSIFCLGDKLKSQGDAGYLVMDQVFAEVVKELFKTDGAETSPGFNLAGQPVANGAVKRTVH